MQIVQCSNTCWAIPELGYKNSLFLLIIDSDRKQLLVRTLYLNVELLLSLCFATLRYLFNYTTD